MLLNWSTIDACFLFPTLQIHSNVGFFFICLGAFLLVISLELLRRLQRGFDGYLRSKHGLLREREYGVPEEMEEKLLQPDHEEAYAAAKRRKLMAKVNVAVVLQQLARGTVHTLQFAVSYCIMLLFMYSNGVYSFLEVRFGFEG